MWKYEKEKHKEGKGGKKEGRKRKELTWFSFGDLHPYIAENFIDGYIFILSSISYN